MNGNSSTSSIFGDVPMAPPDPILGLAAAFKADPSDKKVDLGVGAYRTDEGKPYVLPIVRKVEQQIANDTSLNKEYIPQDGLADFREQAARVLFGDNSPVIKQNRLVTIQSLSGTGALRLGCEFIAAFLPKGTKIFISDPTWSNHFNIFTATGLPYGTYRYLNADKTLNIKGLLEDFEAMPDGSAVVLHLCAHNPSGVDPTPDQWKQIIAVMRRKRLLPFFDSAYQGFASGDLDRDAWAIRYIIEEQNMECMCAQSFAKNFGLYGERVGALHFATSSTDLAAKIRSQLMAIVRKMYSSPPLHGARIVAFTLRDSKLFDEWRNELKIMSGRIIEMRHALLDALKKRNTPGNWECIVNQIGMFSMLPLNATQCKAMIEKHHIYMTGNGRISMAGLNTKNLNYVADCLHDVATNVK